MDELGLQLNDQLSGLPQASGSLAATGIDCLYIKAFLYLLNIVFIFGSIGSKQPAQPAAVAAGGGGGLENDADADLQARLDNLRRE